METNEIRIMLEIRGGNLQAIYSNADVKVVLIDHDNLQSDYERAIEDIYPMSPDIITEEFNELQKEEVKGKLISIGW